MFYFPFSKKVYPLYKVGEWPYPFWISCTFHFIYFTLLTTVTAEKKCLKTKWKKGQKCHPEWKQVLWDGNPVYVWRPGVQRHYSVREIRILFLYMKYLEFSDLSQMTLTGYFRCHSEPLSKSLRSKHSCLWYKMMSAFHFGTGAWRTWGTLSKARKQTLKDHLTFIKLEFSPHSLL